MAHKLATAHKMKTAIKNSKMLTQNILKFRKVTQDTPSPVRASFKTLYKHGHLVARFFPQSCE